MASVNPEYPAVSSPSFDPFSPPTIQIKVHNIRFTVIEGLGSNPYVDTRDVLKLLKKHLGCAGMVVDDPEAGESIVLHGDQRTKAARFLTDEERGPGLSHRFVRLVDGSHSHPLPLRSPLRSPARSPARSPLPSPLPSPRSPRSPRAPRSPRLRRQKRIESALGLGELARLGMGDI